MKQDQSFDGRADKFARNIYDSTKGRIRTTIVWSDIEACLARLGNRPLRILDAGGGFGYFAQKLAAMGHQVELCDLSAEMLDLAREQIAQKGLEDRIRLIHCPIQDLKHHVTGTFDLVLCHAVLEWLAEPRQTLLGLFPFVKAGGILSLLFYNRHGLLFQSLVVGNFDYVRLGLRKKRQTALTPTNPQLPEQVYDWIGRGDCGSSARPGCASSTTTCATSRIRSRSSRTCSPWSSNIAARSPLFPWGATSM